MPMPLVECIPNFSEARRPEIIKQIIDSINSVAGVHVLDRHSDQDHNRTVVTFVGSPQAVEEAAYQAIATAGKLIDLNTHTGAHPRIGATDVVPFVPISDITMQECVEMAQRLAERVASELNIPVYLYEEAAQTPARQNLENIRRGQFEVLKEEIANVPDRKPDFGPCELGPAGATVIGARQPLIAFNIYLTTDDVRIAQKISKAVRQSSGGLRYVKAMGVLVEGHAQVSMNLTNFTQTPIARVVEMVRREAQRYGVSILHSELVGLIPQAALVNAAQWYTQLDTFESAQVLENRLSDLLLESSHTHLPVNEPDFIEKLASAEPTPGGGSAAAHTASAAAALVSMVTRLTIGKKKYEAVKDQMQAVLEQSETLRKDLAIAVDEDAAAFDWVMNALKLPQSTPEQQDARQKEINAATLHAANVPLDAAKKALAVQALALKAASVGNIHAISDAASAATLAKSALICAGYNVRINVASLTDPSIGNDFIQELNALEQQAETNDSELRRILNQRGGIALA